ncbi:MAG TPA: TetR/AcrR family transcriptional regulator C-terminal domain-containing protein [Trebonia sp.]|jgi:AcrR family transcriptional regulator|nr:TetR/AcrR family transcriptional regulator C-terminal domain-containing protein [Trebonia sp.]
MTPGTRPARSRRERPAKPALTRAGIVATALTVMRAEGLDRVTMRRLAIELDTGPASLYVYVRNTAELHAAMLEELLGQIDLSPVAASGPWQERLVEILTSYTAILFEHPGLAQSALVTRPSGPAYLGLVDGILALLDAGGITPGRASWAMDLLLHVATATAVEHGVRERAIDARDEEEAVEAALRDADAGRFPHIAAVGATELMSGPGRLDWGFRVLINGVIHTPRTETEATP